MGGKAVNLCKLSRAKFPVPPGFVVTTRAYLGFIGEDGLGARIAELAASIEDRDAAMIEAISAQIRGLLGEPPVHESLAEEILQAYRRLRDAGEERVAVRSSATAEDLPEASFAGQQDTYLNVRGEEALLKAVQSCWGSLWTARAVAYRAKQKTPAEGLAMAVVVQQMVMADAAGILFTANPVTGARDEIIINAAWGLGEAVVGGEVTPDHVVVEKASGKIKELTVSEKTAMTAITEEGTRQVALCDDRRLARVLGDDEVARLASIGRQIELYYGAPQDIEWAMVGGQFAVLQARPIRGLEVAGDVEAGRVAEIERLARPLRQPAADLGGAQPGRNAYRPHAAHLGHHPPLHERSGRLWPLLPRPGLPPFAPGLPRGLPRTDRPADLRRPGAPLPDVLGQ